MQLSELFNNPNSNFLKLFQETQNRINGLDSDIAVGVHKGEVIYHMCNYAKMLKGDAAEIGVYQGGASRIIAKQLNDRPVRLFDTFEGIPYVAEDDHAFEVGQFKPKDGIDLFEQVKRTLEDCKNIEFFKGIFPDTAWQLGETKYCFVHADADVYQSTKDICEFFYPRMTVGGVILFDDYGYDGAAGCRRAVDQFFIDKPETPIILSTGQALAFKSYETPEQARQREKNAGII